MNYFHSFSSDLFSTNLKDYNIDSCLIPDFLYKVSFIPIGVTCAMRVCKLFESDLELMENEIEIDRLTNHPNLMKMLFHFLGPDQTWRCIFPYSQYDSLGELCKPYGLDEPVIVFVLADILKAVDYLHRNNIIHRF